MTTYSTANSRQSALMHPLACSSNSSVINSSTNFGLTMASPATASNDYVYEGSDDDYD